MKKYLTAFILALMPVSAFAQEVIPECQLLGQHKPAGDVAYTPGVDVHGKPVVPADLGGAAAIVPDTVVVPLSVDLAQRLQNSNVEGLKLEAPLGMLEIHQNGRVTYNGQDWTPQVYALCGKENLLPPLPPKPPQAAPAAAPAQNSGHGQPATDAIKSDAVEIAPVQAVPPDSVVIEGGESREEGLQ